jgi:hypothetical protein
VEKEEGAKDLKRMNDPLAQLPKHLAVSAPTVGRDITSEERKKSRLTANTVSPSRTIAQNFLVVKATSCIPTTRHIASIAITVVEGKIDFR